MPFKLKAAGFFGLGLGSLLAFKHYQRGPHHIFDTDMSGKVVVITGSSAGIGKETARGLAKLGATVVFACRDKDKTLNVIENIKQETLNNKLIFQHLNLSDFKSVVSFNEHFRKQFNKIDILINNAGVIHSTIDADGKDQMFKTNHLGHFLLTQQLIDLIVTQHQSRIINVSSNAHFKVKEAVDWQKAYTGSDPSAYHAYGVTKYANVLFTIGLQKRLQEQNISTKVFSLHPGVVDTEIIRWNQESILQKLLQSTIYKVVSLSLLTEEEGAWTTLYTALAPYDILTSGGFYDKSQQAKYSDSVEKFNQVEELWKFSELATNQEFKL